MIQIALAKLLFDRDPAFRHQAVTKEQQAGVIDGIRAAPTFARERIEAVIADINDIVGRGEQPDPFVLADADRALTVFATACEGQPEQEHFANAVGSFLRGAYIKAHVTRAFNELTAEQRRVAADPSKIVVAY